jgi:2-methylisocitrate lyase-like PEP mutase family enzyme
MSSFRTRLQQNRIVLAPGVCDALSAALAADAGFEALYLSGAGIAYTSLGRPDVGLVSLSEVAGVLARVRERVDLPVIVDADTGWGNAINVQRTVRVLERAGAAAIQLEDQTFPKRCGHLRGKAVIPAGEAVGKIRAALDARREALVVARTDAIAVEGLEAALERGARYAEAGADVVFVEGPESAAQLGEVAAWLGGRVPLLANMVEGGRTPLSSADELGAMGFRVAIFPGGAVRALARTLQDYYASLKRHGTTAPFLPRMLDFDGLNSLLGTEAMLRAGRGYEDPGRAGS